MRVLVVDDDTAVQRHCREVLEAEGFEVVCESSLGSARRFLRHKQADAMLLDLFLPDGCGYDLFRTSPQLMEGLPVVAMTAVYQGSANARLLTMRHPLVSVLAKPIGVSALVEVLRGIFEDAYPQAPEWARISQEVAAVMSAEGAAEVQRSHTGLQPVPRVSASSPESGRSPASMPRQVSGESGDTLARSLPWPGGRREAGVPSGAFAALRSRNHHTPESSVAAPSSSLSSSPGSGDALMSVGEHVSAHSPRNEESRAPWTQEALPSSRGGAFVSPLDPPERGVDVLTGGVMDPPGGEAASGWDISSPVATMQRSSESPLTREGDRRAFTPSQIEDVAASSPEASNEDVVEASDGATSEAEVHDFATGAQPPTEATVVMVAPRASLREGHLSASKQPQRVNGDSGERQRDLVTPRSGVPRRLVSPISRPSAGPRPITSRQARTLSRAEPAGRAVAPAEWPSSSTPPTVAEAPRDINSAAQRLSPRDPGPEGLISPLALDPRRAPLQGRLEETPFPAVLTRLARAQVTGSLLLRRDRIKKIVFMEEGVPSAVKSNLLYECLGQLLVRERVITESDCQRSVERMQETGRFQGEILVEMGLLSASQLEEHLERQLDTKLGDVFGWENGLYQFRAGNRVNEGARVEPRDPFQVILNAVRRHSPLDRVGIDLAPYMNHAPTLLVTRADLKSLQLTMPEQDWLRLVDNHRTLGEILSVTGGAAGVHRLFYSLLCLGLLAFRPQDSGDLA